MLVMQETDLAVMHLIQVQGESIPRFKSNLKLEMS
jgi:hypothetical protein